MDDDEAKQWWEASLTEQADPHTTQPPQGQDTTDIPTRPVLPTLTIGSTRPPSPEETLPPTWRGSPGEASEAVTQVELGETVVADSDSDSDLDAVTVADAEEEVGSQTLVSGTAPSFELSSVIGRGGMGIVYRARQSSLGRDIAVKRLHSHLTRKWRKKFVSEAHVTGRLDHPNIVPIHELGKLPSGEVVLAMKLVEGTSWAGVLHPETPEQQERAGEYDLTDHLRILISVCNAVAFAHSKGIGHNDLKPENVMLGEFGEVLVMDWGLAMDFRDEPTEGSPVRHKSTIGRPCGTPVYMAPELARGEGPRFGPWTDVYLLGAILHEIVVGKPPHLADTFPGVVARAIISEPPTFDDSVPEELQAICRKAMAREPEQRYSSTQALREALEEFLDHRESHRIAAAAQELLEAAQAANADDSEVGRRKIYNDFATAIAGFAQAQVLWAKNPAALQGGSQARVAYGEAAWRNGDLGLAEAQLADLDAADPRTVALQQGIAEAQRARERTRRNARILRWSLTAAVLGIVVSLTVGTILVDGARRRAELSEVEAIDQAGRAERSEAQAREAAERATREERKARQALAEGLVSQGDTLGSSGRWDEARHKYDEARRTLAGLGKSTSLVDLGTFVANHESSRPLLTLEEPAEQVAFAANGRQLLTADREGVITTRDLIHGRSGFVRRHGAPVRDLAVFGDLLAAAGQDGVVSLWRRDGSPRRLEGHEGPVNAVAFSWTGRWVVSAGEDRTLRVWDTASGTLEHTLKGHEGPVLDVHIGVADYAFTTSPDGTMRRWDLQRGRLDWTFENTPATRVFVAPYKAELVLVREDNSLEVWRHDRQRNNLAPIARFRGHSSPVVGVVWSMDGKLILSASLGGRLVVWSAETHEQLQVTSVASARSMAMSRSGNRVALCGAEGCSVWDLGLDGLNPTGAERGREVLTFDEGTERPSPQTTSTRGALSADGLLAASGRRDGRIVLWEAEVGLPLFSVPWHQAAVTALRFGPGDKLFSASQDGAAREWTLTGMQPERTVQVGSKAAGPWCIALSPDGERILAGSQNGDQVHVLDWKGETLTTAPSSPGRVRSLAWFADGTRVLLGHRSGELSAGAPAALTRWQAHQDPITAVATSTSSQVASGSGTGELACWDASGRLLWKRSAHAAHITCVRFSADGKRVYSGSIDGTWRLFSSKDGRDLRTFAGQQREVRDLALAPDGQHVLASGVGGVRLWRFSRTRTYTTPRDPKSLAARAAWFNFRGSQRAAVRLWEELRQEKQRVPTLQLARSRFELGHYTTAARELKRTRGLPPGYRWLFEAALRRRGEDGNFLGREPGYIARVAISPNDHRAASSSAIGTLNLWDLKRRLHERRLAGHRVSITCLAFSPEGKLLATADRKGNLKLWDVDSGRLLHAMLSAHKLSVTAVVFLSEAVLVSTGSDKDVMLWNASTGEKIQTLATLPRRARALATSRDGQWLAAGTSRGDVFVWERSGKLVRRLIIDKGDVYGLAFTKDRKLWFNCAGKGEARLWDPRSGQVHDVVPTPRTVSLAVSRDGRRMAYAGSRNLTVWDVTSRERTLTYTSDMRMAGVSLSGDGRTLVAWSWAGEIRIWDLPAPR